MKSLKTAVAAIMIAGGTIAAFAFTKSDKAELLTAQTELHWFSPGGSYLGEKTIAEQEAECPGDNFLCARGYDGENNGAPVGPIRYEAKKAQP
ncbi:hypothetical protein ACM46_20900 [Chryseobacterium angstadtii]|uniref:Uncharacterized protein n=1 Tax=Chryseobacterium angstadtii TaxID=558151 RepID=A0A0J7I180_9FLAO|nr:hypothetical protein [Chryseobacterium angstadtii]KMQ59541.1 hypothetical protein ACM46_20900 [Chryseobacterium angstadtii]